MVVNELKNPVQSINQNPNARLRICFTEDSGEIDFKFIKDSEIQNGLSREIAEHEALSQGIVIDWNDFEQLKELARIGFHKTLKDEFFQKANTLLPIIETMSGEVVPECLKSRYNFIYFSEEGERFPVWIQEEDYKELCQDPEYWEKHSSKYRLEKITEPFNEFSKRFRRVEGV